MDSKSILLILLSFNETNPHKKKKQWVRKDFFKETTIEYISKSTSISKQKENGDLTLGTTLVQCFRRTMKLKE